MRKYTKEQDDFLRENFDKYNIEKLNLLFCKKFGREIHKFTLAEHCRRIGLIKGQGAPGVKRKCDDEKNLFLIENIDKMGFSILCNEFRKKFNTNVSNNAIRMRYYRLVPPKTEKTIYTEEQNVFLLENYLKLSQKELCKKFNEKFDAKRTIYALSAHYSYIARKSGIYTKRQPCKYKVGDVVMKGKRKMIKIRTGCGKNNLKDVHRLVWEEHYGEIPNGCRIIFLDGNKENTDISNLFLVKRNEYSVLVGNRWFGDNSNNMETKIKYAQLKCALKESEE